MYTPRHEKSDIKINNINNNINISLDDKETIPDEEYEKILELKNIKFNSWNNKTHIGPNINLKCFKKKYTTQEEKHFIYEKIKIKKKTELCKNWELYHDCFYGNECSFAHGIDELRKNFSNNGLKNQLCKTFQEKKYCNFGMRCNYRHIIKEKRLFSYQNILKNIEKEMKYEMDRKENEGLNISLIYKNIIYKRKIDIPRLEIFKNNLLF